MAAGGEGELQWLIEGNDLPWTRFKQARSTASGRARDRKSRPSTVSSSGTGEVLRRKARPGLRITVVIRGMSRVSLPTVTN